MSTRSFAARLLDWYDEHGRKDLPWQRDIDAYRVWVSEIMLQQTQVTTVIPYYRRFMDSFPEVVALADAPLDDVLHHWSGLGYYARARNLHAAACAVKDRFGGSFPTDFDEVIGLPGIGRSTAGAILALAHGQRHPILDGNVKRVLSRYHAVEGWPGKTAVANRLWELADGHTPDARVGAYTQAIMDLGATLCTRSRPDCQRCPMVADCRAHALDRQADFPGRRERKPAKPLKTTHMLLAHGGGRLYLERRPQSGIWGGLWSLPELGERSVDDWCAEKLNGSRVTTESLPVLRHSFSHYDLDIRPILVRVDAPLSKVADGDDATWYSVDEPPPGGIAAPVRKLIDQLIDQAREEHDVTHG